MRTGALLLVLAALAAAQEPDGAIAEPGRWPHPRGPASGSGRSLEPMPQSLGRARWAFAAKGAFLAPPVVWDGVAFVLHGTAKDATLVALDVETGASLATAPAKSVGLAPAPATWNRAVYLVEEGKRLVEFRLKAGRFEQRWKFDGGSAASLPRVHAGEIYWPGAGGLLRLRSGGKKPVWSVPGAYLGEPALFGDHVYAIRAGKGSFALVAHRRIDGAVAAEIDLAPAQEGAAGGRVVVASGAVGVQIPAGGGQTWFVVAREEKEGALALASPREEKLLTQPSAREDRLIALAAGGEWSIVTPKARQKFAERAGPMDLVEGCAAPTSIGGQVCFGAWACDFRTSDVLWHLKELAGEPAFAKGVLFAAVPADGLLLLVSRDGKTLKAFGAEGPDS